MQVVNIILTILLVAVGIYAIRQRQQARIVVERNAAMEQENQSIAEENEQLYLQHEALEGECITLHDEYNEYQIKLSSIRESIKAQENILQSITLSAENLRQGAEQQAQSVYEARIAALNQEFEKQKEIRDTQASQESALLMRRLKEEKDKLADLEAKQLAYIQAQQRAEEMEAQKDYYRLVIEELDLHEIKLLRNLQTQFSRKEAIDKLIWETYYKTAYDLLMSHLFEGVTKICGIYKITNLQNGQAYIGQSVDIRERFRQHIKSALTSGPTTNKLYQQMKKYGPENFTFEILETVERSKLNEREVYWIDFYKTKEFGMNGTKGGS